MQGAIGGAEGGSDPEVRRRERKRRGSEGMQAVRRAAGTTLALALPSQTQGGRMLFGFQSEIRDAGVLAGSLGSSSGSHDGGGRC